ncbi:Uncharacterised protein [Klebsiella quasipneumoniae]|nr:Uncharacterised protein [Klebsiella quasipneumoniae]
MVKMDAWPEEKAPVGGRQLLPVVGNISFQFPIFLIYPRQRAEYLPAIWVSERRSALPGSKFFIGR